MSVEVNVGDVSFVFDPYIKPDEPRFDYIFCSHDHYDHCHEETLKKLIGPGNKRFQMLFASRGCFYASRLESPNNWGDTMLSDLQFVPREKCIALYPKYRHEEDPEFGGPTEVTVGRLRVEGFHSGEDPHPMRMYNTEVELSFAELAGPWPNMGYLVTDTATGRPFAHTGDIWKSFPRMQQMRGKVDVLFYPLGKLPLEEKLKMMDYIRPKIAVPTHYRLFEPDFPIPADFPRGGNPYASPETLRQFCLGHWYPSPDDPPKEIAEHREKFQGLTRVGGASSRGAVRLAAESRGREGTAAEER
ncbi:MAG: MBL fold metallo-hydrolase [Planctomycetes bacterium]|nr:MBL fold metallo-hydrolase [Planctomycetota bacterium]